VVKALDVLFVAAFAGIGTAITLTVVRIVTYLGGDLPRWLLNCTAVLFWTSVAVWIPLTVWVFLEHRRGARRDPGERSENWERVLRMNPVVVGPVAYYVGEYRHRHGRETVWVRRLAQNRSALDAISFIASYGMAALLFLGLALMASWLVLPSPGVFMALVSILALLIPVSGGASTLLAIVMLVHAANRAESDWQGAVSAPWEVRPFPWWSWVIGIRRYYLEGVRPQLAGPSGANSRA
jgi:hypothetical protein